MPSESAKRAGRSILEEKIIGEISRNGPITFARFMEIALYDPQNGYYMTVRRSPEGKEGSGIGWEGDYFTAPELSPLLARSLVRQVVEIDRYLERPTPLVLMEMGAGTGAFARDFLDSCRVGYPDLFKRLSYRIIERSPALQKIQKENASVIETLCPLKWFNQLSDVGEGEVTGLCFSNELVDALPVCRIKKTPEGIREILVDYQQGRFVEHLAPLASSGAAEYIREQAIELADGCTSELHVEAGDWMNQVARVLRRGYVITMDYGHTAKDYYSAGRTDGTLLCYYRHSVSGNPYSRIGEQDITAHVNFSALAKVGESHHLYPVGFTSLANWLLGLDVEEMVSGLDQESEEVRALAQLLHPHGMGKTFKVLVQEKGMGTLNLQGLRYRAFFDDVLSS